MVDGPATATKPPAPDPLIGRVIADRFTITSLIARGGMGKVYRAEQAPLGRLCAVKILNPNYSGDADPEFHRRFYREARIASKITHPNSVTIFDYGKTDDDIYYMAMEYLEGQTLHQALRSGGIMHEERVGRIAQQICRALREAHALGVIHRDLKPANIFLMRHGDEDDFVKILDFGLVKHLSERPEEQLTQTGLFMGSPKYMAPEQIQGGHVDARTDIYSLGIMMYEMLAGKVPFDRPTSVNILMAHVGEPPPPMREVNPNLICSAGFEELVMRCIAKDPAARLSTMDEVLYVIRSLHGGAMTGQLQAITSGSFPPAVGSNPPAPPRDSGIPGGPSAALAPVAISGSHTPMGQLDEELAGSGSGVLFEPRRRSRAWIVVGVLVAAALGGLLGMVAFRVTSAARSSQASASTTPTGTSAPATGASAPATGTSAAAASRASAGQTESAPVESRAVTIHVTTTPKGALVREQGVELCASTPCDVRFEGAAAAEGTSHELVISKRGYRSATRSVDAASGDLHVALSRRREHHASPPPPRNPRKETSDPPKTDPPKTAPADPPTPSGFKEVPY